MSCHHGWHFTQSVYHLYQHDVFVLYKFVLKLFSIPLNFFYIKKHYCLLLQSCQKMNLWLLITIVSVLLSITQECLFLFAELTENSDKWTIWLNKRINYKLCSNQTKKKTQCNSRNSKYKLSNSVQHMLWKIMSKVGDTASSYLKNAVNGI